MFGFFTPFNSWTAKDDIEHGKIQIVEIGELPLFAKEKNGLANKYGFNFHYYGCDVSASIIHGTKYYNEEMISFLESKNGIGWWTKFQSQLDSIDKANTGHPPKFNSEKWLNGDRRIRGTMVDEIINDSMLLGKTKNEILSLLGEPTASDTSNPIVYTVDIGKKTGPLGSGGVWLFYLTLQFDTINNKVIDIWCRD